MSHQIRSTLLDGCPGPRAGGVAAIVDMPALLENLLLFDTFILSSSRLGEVPALVSALGCDGLSALLEAGALQFACQDPTVGLAGLGSFDGEDQGHARPKDHFSLRKTGGASQASLPDQGVSIVDGLPGATDAQKARLREALAKALVALPSLTADEVLAQTRSDLAFNESILAEAICLKASRLRGGAVAPESIRVTVQRLSETDFRITSDLGEVWSFSERLVREATRLALIGLCGLNQRLASMKALGALTSFRPEELHMLLSKLDLLTRRGPADSARADPRLAGRTEELPSLERAVLKHRLDTAEILAIRDDEACKGFRAWLWSTCDPNPAELQSRLQAFRRRLGGLSAEEESRTVHWLAGSGDSPAPAAAAGQLGPLDSFLSESVLETAGAIALVNRRLPSVFVA